MPTCTAMLADVLDRPWTILQEVLPGCVPGLELLGPAAALEPAARGRPMKGSGESIRFGSIGSLAVHRPDLVVCQGFGLRTVQAAAYRCLRRQTRMLLLTQASVPRRWTLSQLLLRRADAVLATGETAARAIRRLGIPAARVFTVPEAEPPDLAPFLSGPARRAGPAAYRLIYAGELTPRAGVADFLLCAAAWAERHQDRPLEIWWAGDGDLRGVLETQPLPANMSLRFLGEGASPTLAAAFAECGLLVIPSHSPAGANWIIQAMAAGLPVIGSVRCHTVMDLVASGETGWVFDPLAPGGMTAAFDRAFHADEAALDAMREAARARARAVSAQDFAGRVTSAVAAALFEGTRAGAGARKGGGA